MGIQIFHGENGPPRKFTDHQITCQHCHAKRPNTMAKCPICSTFATEYTVTWEQRDGARGLDMTLTSMDYESMKFAWNRLCRNSLGTRHIRLTLNGDEFDPNKPWPRPVTSP